jgi:hypothetical protein
MIAGVLAIAAAGLIVCAGLVYGSLYRLGLRTTEANVDFVLTQLRATIEANVDLGLPLSDIRIVQDVIERARAADPQMLAAEVFSPNGTSLFNTDRGSIGEPVPEAWAEAVRYRVENDRWRVEELGNIVVGQVIRNDFGEPVGYLAVTLSGEEHQKQAEAVFGALLGQMALALPATLLVLLIAALLSLRWADRDLVRLSRTLAATARAPEKQGGLPDHAQRALLAIDEAASALETAARQIANIDESDEREAA